MNQYGINIKKTTPRHIMAKLLKTKNKEEILKVAREGKKKIENKLSYQKQWRPEDNEITSLKC